MTEMQTRELISKKIQQLLNEKNITQEELSVIAGVHRSTPNKWITKDTTPRMKPLAKIAQYYNFDVSWFFEEQKLGDLEQKSFERDPEVIALMEEMHKNPNLRILMSTSKNVTKESLEMLIKLAQQMKENDD